MAQGAFATDPARVRRMEFAALGRCASSALSGSELRISSDGSHLADELSARILTPQSPRLRLFLFEKPVALLAIVSQDGGAVWRVTPCTSWPSMVETRKVAEVRFIGADVANLLAHPSVSLVTRAADVARVREIEFSYTYYAPLLSAAVYLANGESYVATAGLPSGQSVGKGNIKNQADLLLTFVNQFKLNFS